MNSFFNKEEALKQLQDLSGKAMGNLGTLQTAAENVSEPSPAMLRSLHRHVTLVNLANVIQQALSNDVDVISVLADLGIAAEITSLGTVDEEDHLDRELQNLLGEAQQ